MDSWAPNHKYFFFYFSLNQNVLDLESEQRISNKINKKCQSGSTVAHLSVYYIYRFCNKKNCWNAEKMVKKLPTWTFLSKMGIFFAILIFTKNSFGYITKTLNVSNSLKSPYYSRFTLSVFFITLEQCYIKNLKSLLGYTFFISNKGQAPALKVASIFKIFRAQSHLTFA